MKKQGLKLFLLGICISSTSLVAFADCDYGAEAAQKSAMQEEAKEGVQPFVVSVYRLESQEEIYAVVCQSGPKANFQWTDLVTVADCKASSVQLHAE